MNERVLPLDAESPDDFLVPYVNGSLPPADRAAVDAWLVENPEWRGRLDAYRAMGAAVRHRPPSAAPTPDIGALGGLWSAIDDTAPPSTVTPFVRPSRRAGAQRWALAAAAALVVVVGGAVVVSQGGDDDQDFAGNEPPPAQVDATDEDVDAGAAPPSDVSEGEDDDGEMAEEAPSDEAPADEAPADEGTRPPEQAVPPPTGDGDVGAPAPGGSEPAAAAVRTAAAATVDAGTAEATLRVQAVVDGTDTPLEEVAGAEAVTITVTGRGQVELPDASVFTTATRFDGGLLTDAPARASSVVERAGRTFERCDGDADYTEAAPFDSTCAVPFGAEYFGIGTTFDLLTEAVGDVAELGEDSLLGEPVTQYVLTTTESIDGADVPATIDVWVGEDGLIRQVRVRASLDLPVGPTEDAGPYTVPTDLVILYGFSDFGVDVDIPDPN